MNFMLYLFPADGTQIYTKVDTPGEDTPSVDVPRGLQILPQSSVLEKDLCGYLLHVEEILLGMTREDARSIANQPAVRKGIRHPFNQETNLAGTDCLQGFLRRHQLSADTSTNTSSTCLWLQ